MNKPKSIMYELRRKLLSSALAAVMLVVLCTGCGTTTAPPPNLDLNPYTIVFTTEPAAPVAGEPVILKASITGKTPLSKRSEISFEIKPVGSDARQEAAAAAKGEGLYEGSFTFDKAGAYSITTHVITRSVHQVSNTELQVR